MPKTKGETSMDRVSRIRRMIEEKQDLDLFSPNYVSHEPWDFTVQRRAQHAAEGEEGHLDPKNVLATMFEPDTLFSNWRIKVEEAFEDGDKVVVRWRFRGRWSKPFLDIKSNNQPIDITGINIYRFVGDKIVESTGEFDMATLARQALAGGASAAACAAALREVSRVSDPAGGPV